MPVRKYRSVEEMPRVEPSDDRSLAQRIRVLWNRSRRLGPALELPRGVRRFRSIEEANAARDDATRRRLRASGTNDG